MVLVRSKVSPLDMKEPIVDPETGAPTLQFVRLWQQMFGNEENTNQTATDAVPQTREIDTTSPLTGGGALSQDLVLEHETSGVTAGSYTNADITVDEFGHITAAADGTAGGGATTPTIRATKIQSSSANSYALTWPTGTVAGDIVLIMGGHGFGFNNPSGWLVLSNLTGSNWNGAAWAKQMTAADITAGGVTITTTGTFNGVIAQLTFIGTTGEIRETVALRNGAGGSPRSLSTSWTPLTTDMAVCFGSNRNADNPTCSYGTQKEQINAASASGVLSADSPASNGVITASFTYPTTSGTTGDYQVIVVIKGAS